MQLPTLVVDDLTILPKLVGPYDVETEEAALVLDRASRSTKHLIFLVIERPIPGPETSLGEITVDSVAFQEFFTAIDAIPQEQHGEDWVGSDGLSANGQYELAPVGIICEVGQHLPANGRSPQVMLHGLSRGTLKTIIQHEPFIVCQVEPHTDRHVDRALSETPMATLLDQLESYISM